MSGFKRKLQDSLLFPRILHLLAARQESGRKWSFLIRKAEKVAPGLEKVEARLKKVEPRNNCPSSPLDDATFANA